MEPLYELYAVGVAAGIFLGGIAWLMGRALQWMYGLLGFASD